LINLLGNAIKFTDTGNVTLLASLVQTGSRSFVQFDVKDTGVGMSAQQVESLFKPFSQADSSTTRRHGGTGLGLAISKRLAELLGGDVTLVAAAPGKGCHFRATVATGSLHNVNLITSITLDGASEATSPSPNPKCGSKPRPAPVDSLKGYRILIAEDGVDIQRLIGYILTKAGAEITIVDDGASAIEAAVTARDKNLPYDAILMDMQMPVLDGYTAARKLRSREYQGVIIALTAHAMAGDRGKCLQAGCDDFTTKPINRRELIHTIRRHVAGRCDGTPTKCPPLD
jgi:CheY-like chemotaxis protein